MSATTTSTRTEGKSTEPEGDRVVYNRPPTVKPLLVRLGITMAVVVAVLGLFLDNPRLLGSTQTTNIAFTLAQLVGILAILRLVALIAILKRTRYVLTEHVVRREFSLLGRSVAKEVPYDLVRSYKRSQSRVESLLGTGSVRVNQGLGNLTLDNARDHDDIYSIIRQKSH